MRYARTIAALSTDGLMLGKRALHQFLHGVGMAAYQNFASVGHPLFTNLVWRDDEYSDPDDDQHGPGSDKFIEELTPVLQAAIDRVRVWQCEKVAEKTFSVEEVLAIMKKECPSWFEKEAP